MGYGMLSKISEEISSLASRNVLIIAEPNLQQSKLLQSLKSCISRQVLKVQIHFVSDVKGKLTEVDHYPAILFAQEYDTLIGLGSNNLLNYTKMISRFISPIDQSQRMKINSITQGKSRIILLPTTPTTGFEMVSSTYTYKSNFTVMMSDEWIAPQTIIYDPLLSSYCSSYEIISSSVLTLSEAIELSFFTNKPNRFSAASIKLINKYLIRATYNKNDIEALEALLKAGMLVGLAKVNHKKYSLSNSFVIPIMQKVDVTYPIALATMLPSLMNMYRRVNEMRGIKIMQQLGLSIGEADESYHYLTRRLANLLKTVGFPLDLQSLGIKEVDLPDIAFTAYMLWSKNKRPECKWQEEDFYHIYNLAYRRQRP